MATNVEGESDEVLELICESCENDGEQIPAAGFCVDCSEYFCENCCKGHRKFNVTRNHVIKMGVDMPKDKAEDKLVKQILVDICPSHIDRFIEFYCQSCDKLCCSVCVHSGHRECKKVDFIPDIVKDGDSFPDFTKFERKSEELALSLTRQRAQIDHNKTYVITSSEKAIEAITGKRDEMKAYFDKLERDLINDVHKRTAENKIRTKEVDSRHTLIAGKLEALKTETNSQKRPRQAVQRFVHMKRTREEIGSLQSGLETLKKSNTVTRYLFEPSNEVRELATSVKSLGELQVFTPETPLTGAFQHDIPMKMTEDGASCRITAMAMMSKGRIVAVDSSNQCLKLIDTEKQKVVHRLPSTPVPHDVTKVKADQLAATLSDIGKVKFISVTQQEKLEYGSEIDVGVGCKGIAYADDKLVISYGMKIDHKYTGKLQIVDMKGTVLHCFSKDTSGDDLFSNTTFVTVDNDIDVIYVADQGKKTVCSMTMEGHILNVLKHLEAPPYLAINSSGSVFINGTFKVFQLGMKSGCVTQVTESFNLPFSVVCWDNVLYAGTNTDVIKVYILQVK